MKESGKCIINDIFSKRIFRLFYFKFLICLNFGLSSVTIIERTLFTPYKKSVSILIFENLNKKIFYIKKREILRKIR